MYQGKTPEKIEGVFCGTMLISSAWYIEGRVEDREVQGPLQKFR